MACDPKKLSELKQTVPHMWRVQTMSDKKATCVAYIDSRDVQDLLDNVVGPENWQNEYALIDGKLFGRVGICVSRDNESSEWIWKTDVGTESKTEAEKGNASDSFKRAAVHFGIGRFLYSLGIQFLDVKKHTNGKNYPCDDHGKILWTGDDLTNYINTKLNIESKRAPIPKIGSTIRDAAAKTTPPAAPPQPIEPKPEPEGRYSKTTNATLEAPTKNVWSEAVIAQVSALKEGTSKGQTVLKKYIPEYNKANNTNYAKVSEFNNDELMLSLISFIESRPPAGM